MTEFITKDEASDGQKRILKVVNRLLENSKKFLEIGQFSSSIPITILAFEEMAKADFLRMKVKNGEEVSEKEWKELTFGKKSHFLKLKWSMNKKAKGLQNWTENDILALNYVNRKLGFNISYKNRKAVQDDVDLFLPLVSKFKFLKEDCFYVNWDTESRKWTYFDRRFSEKIKSVIANYLFLEAKREFFIQKLSDEMPQKNFSDFNNTDWEKLMNSKNRSEVIKIQEEMKRKMVGNMDLFKTAINSYKSSTEKQQNKLT